MTENSTETATDAAAGSGANDAERRAPVLGDINVKTFEKKATLNEARDIW